MIIILIAYKNKGDSEIIDSSEIVQINIIDKYNNIETLHKNARKEEYVLVDLTIDGIYYRDVGIRTKGDTIYTYFKRSKSTRFSYKVELDYTYKNQNYKR